ncbi:MAG: OB-fold nucleic acid binding domain-containing protein [Acidobacteriota bacterium]|jgi:hypothetical protein|nr:OB-fold nucleic acid binding domain-containing protein [Acidobacteriota bacterium]
MLNLRTKLFAMILLISGVLLLAGCPPRERISKIDQYPGRYAGREVTVAGRVVNSYGAMGTGVYQLDDGTGKIWVFSERYGVPGREAKLAVTGRIEEGFNFGGRNFALVLRETRRPHY